MTWSVVGDDEPETMAECYVRSKRVYLSTHEETVNPEEECKFWSTIVEQTKEDNHQ